MTYIIALAVIAWLCGIPFFRGVERRRTFAPDPLLFVLWPAWLCLALLAEVGNYTRRGLTWLWWRLEDLGARFQL